MVMSLASVSKKFQEIKGTVINSSIVTLTIIVEEILNKTIYYCPCVEASQLGNCYSTSNSINSTPKCTDKLNKYYGLAHIVAPAVCLFIFTAASSPKLWKTVTGYCKKNEEIKRKKRMICWTLAEIFAHSMLAPTTWVCFSLIDGKYFACGITPLPYDIGPSPAKYLSCSAVSVASKSPSMSDAFNDNRSLSQLIGWVSTACVAVLGFTIYTATRCTYPLTYYQAKYFRIYRDKEEYEFDDEMKIKAKDDAEKNIRQFMCENRKKAVWDRIATVFSFHRDSQNKDFYSYLHEFIAEEELKKKNETTTLIENSEKKYQTGEPLENDNATSDGRVTSQV